MTPLSHYFCNSNIYWHAVLTDNNISVQLHYILTKHKFPVRSVKVIANWCMKISVSLTKIKCFHWNYYKNSHSREAVSSYSKNLITTAKNPLCMNLVRTNMYADS